MYLDEKSGDLNTLTKPMCIYYPDINVQLQAPSDLKLKSPPAQKCVVRVCVRVRTVSETYS